MLRNRTLPSGRRRVHYCSTHPQTAFSSDIAYIHNGPCVLHLSVFVLMVYIYVCEHAPLCVDTSCKYTHLDIYNNKH